jgi:hypothetical protein
VLRYSQAKTQRHATKCRQGRIGIPFLVGLITKSNGSDAGVLSGIRRRMEILFRAALRKKAVCTENSGSHVVVMQSAEERMRRDATDPLNRAREWRVFVQRSVRSQIVVIAGIGLQNPA